VKLHWHPDNQLSLLVNGEAYFPAVLAAVAEAKVEILIETFILFEDPVGLALQQALISAAQRGVRVSLTVDGYGSPEFSPGFIQALTQAGVQLHVFDHRPRVLGMRLHLIHRLHRKIVVVDARVAFVGGINFSQDHLYTAGPDSKQDYAVRVEGPVVADIHADALNTLAPVLRRRRWRHWMPALRERLLQPGHPGHAGRPRVASPDPAAANAMAAFVKRDNAQHRDDIERCYRMAIRTAREEVIIANAYFFPGFRLLRELRRAARRGVRVQLILQGKPDMAYVRSAAQLLYSALVKDGVAIYEYCERPLHGKVAVVDGHWVTVGSSNLDPLSLALNLEANLMAHDQALAQTLRNDLIALQTQHCQAIDTRGLPQRTMWRYWLGALSFHVSRGFPRWLHGLQHGEMRLRTYAGNQVIDSSAPADMAPASPPKPRSAAA
jgi:cardiolipin synthase A/B